MAGDEVAGRLQSHASVMAVGDDDQSIYAFRGARGQHGRLCARV